MKGTYSETAAHTTFMHQSAESSTGSSIRGGNTMKRIILSVMLFTSVVAAEEPKSLQKCILSCTMDEHGIQTCLYDELKVCGKRQQVCVDTEVRDCKPVLVNLGQFMPMQDPYYSH